MKFTNQNSSSQAGFTLIEILVVLAIMGGLVAMAISRVDNKNNEIKSAVRRFASISKELHSAAKLQGVTLRLAINLGDGREDGSEQSFWVERSNSQVLLANPDEEETKEAPEEHKTDKKAFEKDQRLSRKEQGLPGALRFEDVEVAGGEGPIASGMAYIYFFPQGMVQEAAIHLKASEDLRWTVNFHPLTGKTHILTSYVTLQEIQSQ